MGERLEGSQGVCRAVDETVRTWKCSTQKMGIPTVDTFSLHLSSTAAPHMWTTSRAVLTCGLPRIQREQRHAGIDYRQIMELYKPLCTVAVTAESPRGV